MSNKSKPVKKALPTDVTVVLDDGTRHRFMEATGWGYDQIGVLCVALRTGKDSNPVSEALAHFKTWVSVCWTQDLPK